MILMSEKPHQEELSFSLCSIYKNEEKNLEAFIENHKGLVEEMILVDTGSTDRSNEIVRRYGYTYYYDEWSHHFARARNYSLTKATQSWVIVLDIDEQVLPVDFLRLKRMMKEMARDAYSLLQVNFTDHFQDLNWRSITSLPPCFHSLASGYIQSPLIRVFRNHRGVYFTGAIHELVGESIHELNLSSGLTDIPIYHLGWVGAGRTDAEKQAKQEAYRALIAKEWQKDQSPKMAFYYLSTLADVEERLKLAFRLTRQYPAVKQFWEVMAQSAMLLGQWERALTYANKGLEVHPDHVPLLVIKARGLNETGHALEALRILEPLLITDRLQPVYWFEMFRAFLLLGRKEEARALARGLPPQFPAQLIAELLKVIDG